MKILVTGGYGFIGSAFIRHIIRNSNVSVINLDKLTYAAMPAALEECSDNDRYSFEKGDITDANTVKNIFKRHRPDGIVHLAAESHVDRSIDGPASFIHTNIVGSFVLLDVARAYWGELDAKKRKRFRLHHISTDEVYGSLSETAPAFTEDTPYSPRSPYSASKASADHLMQAWHETYGLPVVMTNCSNNYGPWQFPEKLIPTVIYNALNGNPLPVYGNGSNIRDWLYVEDHAAAIWTVFESGISGERYNIGGNAEWRNIEVVRLVCHILDELRPRNDGTSYSEQITFVTDRPGHDKRYAVNCAKICRELGWSPSVNFEKGLRKKIKWYLENEAWWKKIHQTVYDGGRQGLAVR
jgi:dTDP-glucose 4,6-dehydratase